MLVGMGFVFGFLSLLIIVIKTLIAPLALRFPDNIPQPKPANIGNKPQTEQSAPVLAAISAAVSRYRKDHRK